MDLLGMKNHRFNRFRLQKLLCFCTLSLSILFAGCSSDEENDGEKSGKVAYHYLGMGNPNMPSGGNIMTQYDDAPAGSDISKLVDGDAGTCYLTYHSGVDIKWIGSKDVNVISYTLTSAANSPENDPKSWTLYGSSGNGNWVKIDTQKGQKFDTRKETKEYEVTSSTAFQYYKLSITANNGGSATQIAEWTITAAAENDIDENSIADLMKRAENNTESGITPMGKLHESSKQNVTPEELAWLKDPTKQPDVFGGLTWARFQVVGDIYPFGTPKPADANQHSIGDCCLVAVLSYIAYRSPDYIKSIIKTNDDGTFTVTLYDPKGEKVEVGVDNYFVGNSGGIGAVSGKSNRVTWATVLEKAIIKWHQIYRGSSDIGGIDTVLVSPIITGSGASFTFSPESRLTGAEMRRVVNVSIREGKILIGGFRYGDIPFDNKYHTVSAHAYSLHQAGENSPYLFGMRNPWGSAAVINGYDASREDGLMYIPDDGVIPPMIDIRVVSPGKTAEYALSNSGVYTPPSYAPSPLRVASYVLRPGDLKH